MRCGRSEALGHFPRFRHLLGGRGIALLATTTLTAIGATLATWPLVRHLRDATLGSGEVLLTAWQLNWFHRALLTDPRAWVHANIYFPYGNAATVNDLLLTHAVATLPAAGSESPVLALNLALLGGIVLCAVFAHLLIVELTDAPWAAAVGATLFALSPFRFLHLSHLSIAAAWAVPLFFWALLSHLRQPTWARATLAVASGVAVAGSSLYHAAFVAPIIPLILLFGARRGPGGRDTWLPLLVAGLPGAALVISLLAPYATALRSLGAAAAPSDLMRYGADLSSLARKPSFLAVAGAGTGIDPEARLYPGLALAVLAAGGVIAAIVSGRPRAGRRRYAWAATLALLGAVGIGLVLPLGGLFREAWRLATLATIWVGPLLAIAWAVMRTNCREAVGPAVAIRLGVAGASLSFVLALGPLARHMAEAIGPAPYWLLAEAHSAFEGTRVPARFGGLVVLFLALVAAGALARGGAAPRRLLALAGGSLALVACLGELPVPTLPGGRQLDFLPDMQDGAYGWVRAQPGRFGILELPDWPSNDEAHWRYRSWRALRYMLASKQHGQHLANGNGRVQPFLWRRFRRTRLWSDEFFAFVAAYLPVRYALVHEAGIPIGSREAVWARLDRGTDGWNEVFRSEGTRVYTIDRSFGRGRFVDRLYLRREVASRATVSFSARAAPDGGVTDGADTPTTTTLELLRDGDLVETWPLDSDWSDFRVTVPVGAAAPPGDTHWPRTTVRLSWRTQGESGPGFEIRRLSVERLGESP